MTAPVLMNNQASTPLMSFVMPKDFTLQTTPKPTDPTVTVRELEKLQGRHYPIQRHAERK